MSRIKITRPDGTVEVVYPGDNEAHETVRQGNHHPRHITPDEQRKISRGRKKDDVDRAHLERWAKHGYLAWVEEDGGYESGGD